MLNPEFDDGIKVMWESVLVLKNYTEVFRGILATCLQPNLKCFRNEITICVIK